VNGGHLIVGVNVIVIRVNYTFVIYSATYVKETYARNTYLYFNHCADRLILVPTDQHKMTKHLECVTA
jgi:hypothetical protein